LAAVAASRAGKRQIRAVRGLLSCLLCSGVCVPPSDNYDHERDREFLRRPDAYVLLTSVRDVIELLDWLKSNPSARSNEIERMITSSP
jgi:hypothetical protein